jgi:sugar O-acyltransferase (sialic acid O-acetyltransferase NeuD family)
MTGSAREVVFWGATGQAKVLREILPSMALRLVALFDDTPGLTSPFSDVPLYEGRTGFERWLAGVGERETVACLVAIGGEYGAPRVRIQRYLEANGVRAVTAVHPSAHVGVDSSLGAGSQILAHAVVGVESELGLACIVNTGATVDHEGRLGDGVHIAPGAHLAGCVTVDDFAMIGTGAAVLPRLRIGKGAIVGAGAVVLADVDPWTVVAGNPARVVGRREQREA